MTLQETRKIFLDRYNEFAVDVAALFIDELRDQGHKASGRLIASVVAKVKSALDEIELALSHLDYGIIVNTGVPAANVPYSRGSGAKTSKFIDALIGWIRLRGIAGGLEKTVRSVAFAMATAMKRDGIPTKGSYKFTNNGRRTMWIDYIYNKYNVEWQDRVAELSSDYIEMAFDSMLEKTAKRYPGYIEFSKN